MLRFLHAVANQMPEYAFMLTEIDIGNKDCSVALAKSNQFADTLEPKCVDATFALTDGSRVALLTDEMDFSWNLLKGQVRQELLKSDHNWSHLLVIPTIGPESRKFWGMPEKAEIFFEYQVTFEKDILSIFPIATMVHLYEDQTIRKTIEPKPIFFTFSIIPRMIVSII